MRLTIEPPDSLEAVLKAQANAQGMSAAGYVRRVLERDLAGDVGLGETADRFTPEWQSMLSNGYANCANATSFQRASAYGI
jgi:hypothetical protein